MIEDEAPVLDLTRRALNQQGYKVLTAPTPAEALRLCAQHREPIHLLLTDIVMPDMNGIELAQHIQKLRPDIRVLFMSGYSSDSTRQQYQMLMNIPMMRKPFTLAVLARQIRAALDAPTPPPS